MTDNSTFFAGTVCLFGKENFWFFASKSDEPYADNLKLAKAHFAKRGFTAPVAVEGVAKMVYRQFRIVDC